MSHNSYILKPAFVPNLIGSNILQMAPLTTGTTSHQVPIVGISKIIYADTRAEPKIENTFQMYRAKKQV
jgi:hypothetical protein